MTKVPVAVYGFKESQDAANRLAGRLKLPAKEVAVHRFPDGESLVQIDSMAETAVIYRSLNDPNDKLVELMLAASILRESGSTRLILIAPYLCYMRQDMAFHPGEAISQRVVGRFLDGLFDAVVTVDPHLHRTRDLADVFPTAQTAALSAAPLLVDQLRTDGISTDALLVGPDSESEQWVNAVAVPLGLEVLLGGKIRHGDKDVRVEVPRIEIANGRHVILIDDMVSTGSTLIECARQLTAAGAAKIEALVVHNLTDRIADAALRKAGIARIRSADSVPHPTNDINLAPLLAAATGEFLP